MARTVKYNPITGRWEKVPDDWDVKYNTVEDRWEFAPPGSKPVFNEVSGDDFQLREPGTYAGYNPITDEWEAGASRGVGKSRKDFEPVFDPVEFDWELKP